MVGRDEISHERFSVAVLVAFIDLKGDPRVLRVQGGPKGDRFYSGHDRAGHPPRI